VSKLTDEQKRNVQDAFQRVRSIHIAQVLLAAGVLMPKYILADCVSYLAPLELIHFYLEKGVDRANLDGPGFALQRCVSPFNKPSIYSPYVALLLDLGTNIKSLTSRGFTVFHHAAKEPNIEFCECVVDYFLKKEKAAIISYLGCLRKKAPKFYSETKHLHRSLFKCFAPLAGLQEALEIKAQNYGIAYQIKPLEILNPANCTYAKLQLLRSAECPK